MNGAVDYRETATRHDVTAGYLNTSQGRVLSTVRTDRSWSNSGTISDNGLVQTVRQSDRITQRSLSTTGRRVLSSSSLIENYPITVDYSAAQYVDDQNFSLTGTVHMGQQVASVLTDGGRPVIRGWNWTVDSYGVLSRAQGVTSASDGHSRTAYVGTDDRGRL